MATSEFNLPFVSGLGRALAVAGAATDNAAAIQNLLREFGWQVSLNDQQASGLKAVLGFSAPVTQLRQLLAALEQDNADKAAIAEGIFQIVHTLYDSITNLSGASLSGVGFPFDRPGFAEEFAEGLAAKLLDDYLQYNLPTLHGALFILGILDAEEIFPTEAGRLAYTRRSIHWDRISKAISDPPGLAADVYGWNTGVFRHRRFLDALELLLEYAGVIAHQVRPSEHLHLLYYDARNHAARAIRSLEIPLFQAASADFEAVVEAGLIVLPIPPKGAGGSAQPVGFAVTPMIRGAATPDMLDDASYVTLTVTGSFATDGAFRVDIRPDAVESTLDPGVTAVEGGIGILAKPPEPWIALGDAEGSHLALLGFSADFQLKGTVADPEFIVALNAPPPGGSAAPNLALVLSFANSDGFLQKTFGSGQHRLELGLGMQWSSKHGLRVNGQAGFETQLPAHIELGPVTVNGFFISAKAVANPAKVNIAIGAGFSLKLGPLLAAIDNVGLKLESQQRGQGEAAGTFGDLKLDFSFKPPTGVALSLDTPTLTLAGFLDIDEAAHRYAGAVDIRLFNSLELSAIGVVDTVLPDGSKGFSLLFLIDTIFPQPIFLGYNFYLAGVGGMLGLHRSTDLDRLRNDLRNGAAQNILFPRDVAANMTAIISQLEGIFPPKRDQFIIGPMARITWSVPPLIVIDLGLIIEFNNPTRVAVLGLMRAAVPDQDDPLVDIKVAFLGAIDFQLGLLTFDASIYDSYIGRGDFRFSFEGDIAVRLSWGQKKDALSSVGGFHPAYTAPAYLRVPKLRRITLSLLKDNPRLRLTSYFAVTTNTVQFGAELDFYFGVSGLSVVGDFGFDVLFQFDPFSFIASVRARVAVRSGSTDLFSLSLTFQLQGTTPWTAKGDAKFSILFFSFTVHFEKTWGERIDISAPAIAILPAVLDEFRRDVTWKATLSETATQLVQLFPPAEAAGALLVDAAGVLEISQTLVPLGAELKKFNNARPSDISSVNVFELRISGSAVPRAELGDVSEEFAPQAFRDLSDKDKLAAASYEPMKGGVAAAGGKALATDYVIGRPVTYENIVDDGTPNVPPTRKKVAGTAPLFTALVRGGAVGASPLSRRVAVRRQRNSVRNVSAKEEAFSVVSTADLTAVDTTSRGLSRSQAQDRIAKLIVAGRAAADIDMVPAYRAR